MKRNTLNRFFFLIPILLLSFVTSCTGDDFEIIEPTIDANKVEEILNSSVIDWNVSSDYVSSQMKKYNLVTSQDDVFLMYSNKDYTYYVSYQFSQDSLYSTLVLMPQISDNVNLDNILSGYTFVGKLDEANIYLNEDDNVMACAYELIEDSVVYQAIGFTPIASPLLRSPVSKTITIDDVSFKMVYVVGGTFKMGATPEQKGAYSDEKPVHDVTLDDYYIAETEVTQELWIKVMGANPSYYRGDTQYPVGNVSWNDCQTFISRLNDLTGESFRLPSEAEWEYAARGGNQSNGYMYSGSNVLGDIAWENSTGNCNGTQVVKTKSPNEIGVYDMSGNVLEWCQDWYGSYSSTPVSNPIGPKTGSKRVYRGGSAMSSDPGYCRVALRYSRVPTFTGNTLGLRLAL